MTRHTPFILTPLSAIIKEAAGAIANLGVGIDSYPLRDYFLRSLFLKLSGAQEQKCKCICWDMATYDYEYRYETYSHWTLGECSNLKDKNRILTDLLTALKNAVGEGELVSLVVKWRSDAIKCVSRQVDEFYQMCAPLGWPRHEFDEYERIFATFKPECLLTFRSGKGGVWSLLRPKCEECPARATKHNKSGCATLNDGGAKETRIDGWAAVFEECVYRYRNESAHNTLSYQINKPSLGMMASADYCYRNPYLRLALLLVVDEMFVSAYGLWLKLCESHSLRGMV